VSADNSQVTITWSASGWRRFFTWTYWRIQLPRLFRGQPPLHIMHIFESAITNIRLADEEAEKGGGQAGTGGEEETAETEERLGDG